MKWVKTAIGSVIAVSVIPTIVSSITKLTNTTDGVLKGTVTATLLDLAPLIFVAGILAYLFASTGRNE